MADASVGARSEPQGNISQSDIKVFAKFPPEVESVQVLGHVRDVNGIHYSRDICRSFQFGGNTFFIFGDTFCKNSDGEYVGLQDNTVAIHPSGFGDPTVTCYLDIAANGMVRPLIQTTDSEKRWLSDPVRCDKDRFTFWCFGGTVEHEPKSGTGWIFFEKGVIRADQSPMGFTNTPCGVGIAQLWLGPDALKSFRLTDEMLFSADEPRFGSFTVLQDGTYLYLYGHHGSEVYLARGVVAKADRIGTYRYWDGDCFVQEMSRMKPVFKDMQQGSIARTDLFSEATGQKFLFIGCNKWADSKVQIGTAPNPEGPWTFSYLCDADPLQGNHFTYCMYHHPWASSKGRRDELFLTWCEGWPHEVVAAKLKLKSEDWASKAFRLSDDSHEVRMGLHRARESVIRHYPGVQIDFSDEGMMLKGKVEDVKEAYWLLERRRLLERRKQENSLAAERINSRVKHHGAWCKVRSLLADLGCYGRR